MTDTLSSGEERTTLHRARQMLVNTAISASTRLMRIMRDGNAAQEKEITAARKNGAAINMAIISTASSRASWIKGQTRFTATGIGQWFSVRLTS